MDQNLNTKEAAIYLKSIGIPFSEKTLEVWRCLGRGPRFKRIGRRVFYEYNSLIEFSKGKIIETNHNEPSHNKDKCSKASC